MEKINDDDKQALNKLRQKLVEAWKFANVDVFMDCFTNDVTWIFPKVGVMIGQKNCREYAQKTFEGMTGKEITMIYEETVLSGDWGYQRVVEPEVNLNGIEILQKQTDGSWKISCYIWNTYSTEQ